MPSEVKLIHHSVGTGARNLHGDVANVQQLLIAAGSTEPSILGGGWGKHSAKALAAFLEQQKLPVKDKIEPDDECLLSLAQVAGILIPMPNRVGGPGIMTLHHWLAAHRIGYEPGADHGKGTRSFYGLDFQDDEDYAIQRNQRQFRRGPVLLNCTTYVNIMVSVFKIGNIHDQPYDGACGCYGGNSATHLPRDRYGLPLMLRPDRHGKFVNYFSTEDEIDDATQPKNLYVIEVATAAMGVSHMAILYNDVVYECTTGHPAGACIARPLSKFLANKVQKFFYLFGPFPG
jgi:hypothetical protein